MEFSYESDSGFGSLSDILADSVVAKAIQEKIREDNTLELQELPVKSFNSSKGAFGFEDAEEDFFVKATAKSNWLVVVLGESSLLEMGSGILRRNPLASFQRKVTEMAVSVLLVLNGIAEDLVTVDLPRLLHISTADPSYLDTILHVMKSKQRLLST